MIFTNFNFPTLVSVVLLTFSLDVFSTGTCTPTEDEFRAEIAQQEKLNQRVQVAKDEGVFPETNEAYIEIADRNINTLTTNSELSISEVTGETLDEIGMVTKVATGGLESLSELLGPAGIVVTVGLVTLNIVSAFSDPNTSAYDRAKASIGWSFPVLDFILNLVDSALLAQKLLANARTKLREINQVDHYDFQLGNITQDKILEKIVTYVEKMTNKQAAVTKHAMVGINKKLSDTYRAKYLHDVSLLKTHVKQLFADKWIKISPKFLELINFMDKSNASGGIVDTMIQDEQWHYLSDNGRVNSASVLGLRDFAYKNTPTDAGVTLDFSSMIKSSKLDYTWFIGGVSDIGDHDGDTARYLVVSLRNTPNQHQGMEYKAHSIYASNDVTKLVAELPTMTDFKTAGWTVFTRGFEATDFVVSHPVDVAVPDIITGQTIELCGIGSQVGNFLLNKTTSRIGRCLDSISQDYKNHFAAYELDDTIQVNTRKNATLNVTIEQFVQTYGQTFNHLLAQTKIGIVNKFYQTKKPINAEGCRIAANNLKEFMFNAEELMFKEAEADFRKQNNLDDKGRSKAEICWKCNKGRPSDRPGLLPNCISKSYICPIADYDPPKNTALTLALNAIRQQVAYAHKNCLTQKDTSPIVFARRLTEQGNFYLDTSDSRGVFEEIFEGVRIMLQRHFVKNIRLSILKRDNLAGDSVVVDGNLQQWATLASASSQYNNSDFSANQATGAPQSSVVGNAGVYKGGSWAQGRNDRGKLNTLTLIYNIPVYASKIIVRESLYSGTISKVEAYDSVYWHTIYSATATSERGGAKTGDEHPNVVSDTEIILLLLVTDFHFFRSLSCICLVSI